MIHISGKGRFHFFGSGLSEIRFSFVQPTHHKDTKSLNRLCCKARCRLAQRSQRRIVVRIRSIFLPVYLITALAVTPLFAFAQEEKRAEKAATAKARQEDARKEEQKKEESKKEE